MSATLDVGEEAADTWSAAPSTVARTTVIRRPDGPPPTRLDRRATGGMTRRDILTVSGAGVSAVATTLLLFGRLTPLSGRLGFVVVAYLFFLAAYAAIVAIDEPRPVVVDKVMSALL